MNQLFNRIKMGSLSLSIAVFGLAVASPVMASALDGQGRKGASAAATTPKTSSFCTNLPNTISTVGTNISNLTGKLSSARTTREQQLAADQAKWNQEIVSSRANWDQKRQTMFTKLESRAKNATQTAAVKAYETTITNAVGVRRAANDQARTTYRSAVANTIAAKRSTIDTQLASFKGNVSSAESSAQASCQATPDQGPAIRATFQAALKSARQSYSADRKSDGTVGAQIKQLAQTRDASFHSNNAAYTVTAHAAQATLKSAFGSSKV